jgi:hypothetical protein
MAVTSRVEYVVRSAWERRLLVIAVERTAIAAAIVLAALVLLLLVGTQVLDWPWLLFLAVVGLGIAGYQVRQRLLGHYRVAQLLDGRLQLADSLSTAWYLRTRPGQLTSPVAEYQLQGAETAAETVNVAEAFPFTGRRLWSIAGALALVAASLFGVRYFVTKSLSLQPSLIPFQLSDVFERNDKDSEETERQREQAKGDDSPRSQKSTPKAEGQKDAKDPQRAEQPPMPQGNTPGAAGQDPNNPAQMRDTKQSPDDQAKQHAEGASATAQEKSGDKQGEDGEKQSGSEKQSNEESANNPKSANGLIDKMKDALSSLAAKMRPNSQGKQQSNEQKSGEEKSGGDQKSGSQDQSNAPENASASQQASEEQQASAGQQGKTQEMGKAGQGKSNSQEQDKSKSDSKSGVGSQDGDKSTKDADQLKAMGKLAEIIGKRSASATGDVMVENPSGKQRLQTEYSQRLGQHSDLGGEINRDEVPLMYQRYVREYMAKVRLQAKHHKPSHVSTEER